MPERWSGPHRFYNDHVALFEPLFQALNEAGVRYVVVGGVAVVLHGHARLTADIDLACDLAPAQARLLIETLVNLGFAPRASVEPLDFADPNIRQSWIDDKGMEVFSMVDRADPMRAVDIFAASPIEFEQLLARADEILLEATAVRVASIPDLIQLKRLAGRPQDLADIEQLERILRRREGADG
ncbi:MAG TPA: hypothetical protein DCP38_07295 [Acidobacteria bacterium]|nr:hypothetical protein [Acidobacteriota bacterium]HAK55274.1 hypothetical protein [Acidobacteriota bacterium]